MPGWLRSLMKGTAFILAVILVVITPLALLAWDVGRVVFNPTLVKEILTDEVANTDLIPVALGWFAEQAAKDSTQGYNASSTAKAPDIVGMLSLMDRNDWRAVTNEVLPPAILEDWISATVDGLYAWLDGNAAAPKILWNIQPLKERLSSEHGVKVILIVYENLPTCTDQQIAEFARRLLLAPQGEKVQYSLCKFPNVYQGQTVGWLDDQVNGFTNSLGTVLQSVPNQINLTEALSQGDNSQSGGAQGAKDLLRTIRGLMNAAWLLISFLMVLILVLAVRTVDNLARWWGIPLVITGVFTLLPGLIYKPLVRMGLEQAPLPELQPVVIEEIHRLGTRLTDAAFRPMVFQAIILILAAVGLMAWVTINARQAKPAVPGINPDREGHL